MVTRKKVIGKKLLTKKEINDKLQTSEVFRCYASSNIIRSPLDKVQWEEVLIIGVIFSDKITPFISVGGKRYSHCAIDVPYDSEPFEAHETNNLKLGDVVKSTIDGGEYMVIGLRMNKCNEWRTLIHTKEISNIGLFYNFTHLDGTPIGKVKESEMYFLR